MMAGTSSPRFRLTLLGSFELTGPDGVVDLPSKKLAALLAYLACTVPKAQPRERLSSLLWGSYFEAQAKQNLRQALFRLRKLLGQDALESDGEVVSLNPAVVLCDVGRFQALVQDGSRDALSAAGDLYRGLLIDDLAVSEEGWNEWLTRERERLLELALGAMMRLGEQELAAGRAEHALRAGQRAITLNNLREDAHRLIVLALAAAGRKAEALKHYQGLVALLKRELNTEPDAATKALVAELRSTQPPSRSPALTEVTKPVWPPPEEPGILPPIPNAAGDRGEKVNVEKPTARGDAPPPAAAARSTIPERRQLTIMVCTMVASTPLLADLDPEEMTERIAPFHKVVADVAARFGGFVAQYLGDAVHVYFGYPAAHEHDAEQAVRASLALLDAVGMLKTFRARAGIATGLVVVGEQLGTGNAQQHIAIGDAPNLAARLQAVAAPGEVVVAASTRRLVGGMFDYRALAADELKGLPPSVEAWRVRGETGGVSRFEARRTGTLSPLVGRQEEMELLLRRWDQAKAGEGRVILLSGEPGIGKSRIAESLLTRLEGQPHTRLRYFCSPHHTQSPLYPSIAQLERAASFEPGSNDAAKLNKLEALLKPTARNVPQDLTLIAELMALPLDGRYPPVEVSPQQKREMTLGALLHQLEGIAAQSPVLVVFEDIQWIDPTSLDLLDRTVARLAELPVLLIVTFRPEFQPAWVGQPHATMLALSRLSRRDSADLIGGIANGKALPDAVIEQVLAHGDGVPLFIEELTSSLLESGVLRETADGYALDGPLPALAIPTTLQASLVARLDRLGPVKGVAQIGAAMGRVFSHELIGAVASLSPAELNAALEGLTASGLISRRGTPPLATYAFKHALVQDAAYATLLKSRRQQLHGAIARALEEGFPEIVETEPETIAHHLMEASLSNAAGERISEQVDQLTHHTLHADLCAKAAAYFRRAGLRAMTRAANREAVAHLAQSLIALRRLPEVRKTTELVIDIHIDLQIALSALGDWARSGDHLHEAEALARSLGDQHRLGQIATFMVFRCVITGDYEGAVGFGQEALTIARSRGDFSIEVVVTTYLGITHLVRGEFRDAITFLERNAALEGDQRTERFGGGSIQSAYSEATLADVLSELGRFDAAIGHAQAAVQIAQTADHPHTLYFGLFALGLTHLRRGDIPRAIHVLERSLDLSRKLEDVFRTSYVTATLGAAYALAGRPEEALPLIAEAVEVFRHREVHFRPALILLCAGNTYLSFGQIDEADSHAREALALTRRLGARANEAHALCLIGDIATTSGDKEAEEYYRQSIALAEPRGMRPLVAHCHLGLGKLYRRTNIGEHAQARLNLAAKMYREMGMTCWQNRVEAELPNLC
jgi:class 3 adenylate cyclase/DNA-binding SARP family transcriptional activator